MASPISDVKAIVKRAAEEAGFDLAGIAPATDAPELQHFPEWIAAGRAGEMKYMEALDDRGDLKRASLARVAPWARSVIVCAINYNTKNPYSTEVHDPDPGMDFALCLEPRRLSRSGAPPAKASGIRFAAGRVRRALLPANSNHTLICRHWTGGGARLREVCRSRLDRQEHLHHRSEKRFVAFSGRDSHLA